MRSPSISSTLYSSNNEGRAGGMLMERKILPQFNSLTQSIRKLLLDHLAKQVRTAFSQADNSLFKCAEKAENNQVQTMFFESIREVRDQHLQIERTFLQSIGRQFDSFIAGQTEHKHNVLDIDAEELSLVKTDDFEESLLITSMSRKVSERCMEALYGIEQRLALINNGQKPGDNNPLTPTFIAHSFYTTIASSSFNLQIKTILYMLFEQFVMHELDDFYAATNALFIEAGVLPNLKYSAAQKNITQHRSAITTPHHNTSHESLPSAAPSTPSSSQQPTSNQQAVQGHTADRSAIASHSALDETTRLQAQTINTLLSTYRQQTPSLSLPDGVRSITAFTPSTAYLEYSTPQLLQSLTQLQQQTAEQTVKNFTTQTVDNIKNALIEQLQAINNDAGQHKIADQQANTIDLVGMLFNFIIEDSSLPETSKTILSNLHSLYLQVALQDPSLFTQHQHPARKLLNDMAYAGALYQSATEESALQQKMQAIVSDALRSYNNDNALFEHLIQDFNAFVAALKQRGELRERRAVEAAKGRDKLLAARNQACALVNRTIKTSPPPAIIRKFLEHTWVDVLVFAFLRHGPASPQWQRYAEAAQQLAWSGTFLEKTEEQQRLKELRKPLLDDLQKGLELLGSHHPDMIRKLLHDLVACQHAVQAQQATLAETISSDLPNSPLGTMLGEEQALEPVSPVANLSSKAQEIAYTLEHISFGTWLEFYSPPATLKLSWFSPTTRNYMFVDASGQRVAIKSLTALAVEIEQGKARIIEKNHTLPLMDRALSAIQNIFQHFNHNPSQDMESRYD